MNIATYSYNPAIRIVKYVHCPDLFVLRCFDAITIRGIQAADIGLIILSLVDGSADAVSVRHDPISV